MASEVKGHCILYAAPSVSQQLPGLCWSHTAFAKHSAQLLDLKSQQDSQ